MLSGRGPLGLQGTGHGVASKLPAGACAFAFVPRPQPSGNPVLDFALEEADLMGAEGHRLRE